MMYRVCLPLVVSLALSAVAAHAACTACDQIQPGIPLGMVTVPAISEASGLAASRRNPGVLWTHNDGARERVYALGTNGLVFATYSFSDNVEDIEDIAVGPGPLAGVSYVYIGDIGGNDGTNGVRNEIQIIRAPEPRVDINRTNAPNADLQDAIIFTLTYPDGSYDAETLMLDPVLGGLLVATKDPFATRLYRADLSSVSNGATLALEFLTSLPFVNVSGGDISHDGSQIILRREDAALLWARCDNEPLATALARDGQSVPVIGPPTEPNGEGIAFAAAASGYFTISEGLQPSIYFLESLCPGPPQFTLQLADLSAFIGGNARLEVMTVAHPSPAYTWHFNGEALAGETNPFLTISNLTTAHTGVYQLTASNAHGVITTSATLNVRTKPDLRITEVLPDAADAAVPTADWWELTSFENESVNLSGWRFNDSGGGHTDPFTIPAGVSIAPGESIVFVENLAPPGFRLWWGAANLPSSLQIVSYSGNGLGLGANGDDLRLWDSATTDVTDTVAAANFGAAATGISFNYDPITGQFGNLSRFGQNGVFRAGEGTDIGSPGRIVAPAASPTLTTILTGSTLRIQFDAQAGHRYLLEARDDLSAESWAPTGDTLTATNNIPIHFQKTATAPRRFYRVAVD